MAYSFQSLKEAKESWEKMTERAMNSTEIG